MHWMDLNLLEPDLEPICCEVELSKGELSGYYG